VMDQAIGWSDDRMIIYGSIWARYIER